MPPPQKTTMVWTILRTETCLDWMILILKTIGLAWTILRRTKAGLAWTRRLVHLTLGGMTPDVFRPTRGFLQDGLVFLDVAHGVSCCHVLEQMLSVVLSAR